jgi:molybdenum cofactor cytidylyltransferase
MFEFLNAWLNGPSKLSTNRPRTDVGAGLLLAAGRGTRFDVTGRNNKLLANLDGLPVVCHSAANLAAAVEKRMAVIRPDSPVLRKWLEEFGYIVVECQDAHSGMGHSLAWGVAEAMKAFDMQTLVIALGDMPYVKTETISTLLEQAKSTDAVVAPSYRGKRGNPVVFRAPHFEGLWRLSGDKGASEFIKNQHTILVDVEDPGIHRDVDLPQDLKVSTNK